MSRIAQRAINWTETGLVPDAAIRAGIRRLLARRLAEADASDIEAAGHALNEFVDQMRSAEVAPLPQRANEQHYEVPASFFAEALGRHGKYSCCYWPDGIDSLDQAEDEALTVTCERAAIADGMSVLDLGCGWGSLSLWIAKQHPSSRVTAVSNSSSQREHIQLQAQERGLENIEVLTCDMNDFEAPGTYDRVVSVEMFEHMRNYEVLFGRVSRWLAPDGLFFMHIFTHRLCAYTFEDRGPSDWMSRYFFAGGIMPSADLPLRFQRDLQLQKRWSWSGRHYEKTANAWLQNMDQRRDRIIPIFEDVYGKDAATQWFHRWRMFFMACAELFGYSGGQEWFVSHYLFARTA
ncbi:MAG: cyclopropane-fatty-acyl-phospholipid synthase family protein [Gammaproteobacteria bacterium]|nr:cyclopropane-fatty-acyl-phospholipid synthase family protein [Gammaproteobacteria bacterium]NNF61306.1 class I SAM-dependent methyltransferase [Gammaproteobacteria bacterium]NNM20864.1 class I SAM-dependent methyltransferase [Gammaproteobacteria bacterium]